MNLSGFDLNLLRVLDALLREGSTVRAGQRIGLSQPAVSAALGRLRHALGDPLFVRQGQRLVATDFARSLEAPLTDILGQLEALLAGPPAFDPATARHRFRISGADFFSQLLMPHLADALSRLAPGIKIQMTNIHPGEEYHALEDPSVDLALLPETRFPDWLEHEQVLESRLVVIARQGNAHLAGAGIAPGHGIPLDLFCGIGQILFSPDGSLRGLSDTVLDQIGRTRDVVMTMPAFVGVCNAVAQSDFIALVPHQVAHHMAGPLGLDIYPPPFEIPPIPLHMGWHRRLTGAPPQIWLRRQVKDALHRLDA
ncbi:LysR family transcriptional regulator [Actibacterium sp. XHP0104]|uniref:LysR family transcriptional regulator n=1 Tax=Actibacterium sp. XHP0104 TaxID=2984335 RepID=UPI0021E7250E|nr:LysR family transcriptional regulator [Actibacterium sp. XHP0104]MCV2881744.1 LysR family transcriptional regulator [Actibacterium sp. XHP0104]